MATEKASLYDLLVHGDIYILSGQYAAAGRRDGEVNSVRARAWWRMQMRPQWLRSGDIVEVRSPAEILATLDDTAALDGLPFMPEMLQYCGQRFAVDKRTDKICDTARSGGSMRLPDAVVLDDLRCDGRAHDGCEAECRLLWKASWLRRVDPCRDTPRSGPEEANPGALASLSERHTKQTRELPGNALKSYRCQATELHRASHRLRFWDPIPLVRELANGNVPFGRFLRVCSRAAIEEPARVLHFLPAVFVKGSGPGPAEVPLNLQPGEWVQVKTREEIEKTLTQQGRNRGLAFDREMLPHCGRTCRVRRRVTKFVDDRNGEMIQLKSDCVTLEGVVCSGDFSAMRWFCCRAIYSFWREAWLRRVDPR
jgi:hypothetical protein